jgi:5-oxoprolinase (ATP-hydrolysing)
MSIDGPAIVMQDTSTILIEPGCSSEITQYGDIVITVATKSYLEIGTQADPVQVSIFGNLFMSIAEQMGRTLQRTAISTNIKERLDFSCAIFDETGGLVANAPHQPVHLGAMSEAVRQQAKLQGKLLKRGDVLLTNHPIAGGSHLPDITVITPVWQVQGSGAAENRSSFNRPIFYVASRGHHADIGGISPGSMPPFSRELKEEGACIKTFKLVENGVFNEEGITVLLQSPGKINRKSGETAISGTRLLSDNLSDLRAQVAANQRGIDLLLEMVEHFTMEKTPGLQIVQAYMHHIQSNAEEAVRNMLKELSLREGLAEVDTVEASDFLDDGSELFLRLTIDRRDGSAVFDFTGTGPELWGNLNAPRAVTHSAILYSLRCLIDQGIPLNQGCLNPIKVIIEDGSLLAPSENAAVVGGNVLTSQRITDVILKAFRACAASQGCMNNFTFGNDNFGYYETIGGGAGAGPDWHGQSGVHTHMTNTRITDPEILERRYPVMLREFSIRNNSGGSGIYSGGNGLVREVEFLEPLNTAILSERRVHQPYGLNGGEPGRCGRNLFIRNDGSMLHLGGKNEISAEPGDRIRIETPGGGGYGKK